MSEERIQEVELTPQFMFELWGAGLVGYKEFRNWLALQYDSFDEVRDSSVDDMVDDIGREMVERRREWENRTVGENADPASGAAAGA
jgi:hypothetical protein